MDLVSDDYLRHNCGFAVTHTLHDAYSFGKDLQHRGREAAGIAAISNERIDVLKWKGPITTFDITDLHKIFPGHDYNMFMTHVRYATRGRKDRILEDAHPHAIGGTVYERGNHTFILNCDAVIVHNGQINNEYFCNVDKEKLKTDCDSEAFLHLFMEKGEYELLKKIPGAYTLAIADKRRKDVIVLRDKTGIKPGVIGWKDGKYVAASEDTALTKNGGSFVEDLEPGCVYYFTENGNCRKESVVAARPAYCFFEYNYLADALSTLNGITARTVRITHGETMADEFKPDIELVTFLPRCPEFAGRSYAAKRGIKFKPVFYKMKGERSFMGSTEAERRDSIESNLHLLPEMENFLNGKTLLSMDDSTIRGNNSRRERELLYKIARVKESIHASYTPQVGIIGDDGIKRGCLFGVDQPPDDNFIARSIDGKSNRTLEEISADLGMPTFYLSMEGMLNGFEKLGMKRKDLCTYCIGGKHPFENL